MIAFICIFLITSDVEHFFMCLMATHVSSSWSICLNILSFFFFLTGLSFLLLSFWVLTYPGYKSFDKYMFCEYFLPICILLIHFLIGVFNEQKFLNLKSTWSVFFFFMVIALCDLRNFAYYQVTKTFSCFSVKTLWF